MNSIALARTLIVAGREHTDDFISLAQTEKYSVLIEASCTGMGRRELSLCIAYNTCQFNSEFIEVLLDCLTSILQQLPHFDSRPVSELVLVSHDVQLSFLAPLQEFCKTYPARCVHEVIEERCELSPEQIAAVFNDEQITFGALNAQANQLARYLVDLGSGPEVPVAIHSGRSIDLLIAVLAVLKTGAAFLLLDASLPAGRVRDVVQDSRAPIAIATSSLLNRLEGLDIHVVCLESDRANWQQNSPRNVQSLAGLNNLAYVTYTSGSTGKPKGVMIEHRHLTAFLSAADNILGTTPGVWLFATNISFDIAVGELLWTLSRGFKLVLHEGDEGLPVVSGPRSVPAQIRQHGVTHLQGTPSLMRLITSDAPAIEALKGIQRVFLGGEPFPPALASLLLSVVPGNIINGYGPTETTICSTGHVIQEVQENIPIGRPFCNTSAYVLDKWGRLLPPLAPGELFIGGASVGRGYLGRPDLTAERFISNPFSADSCERLYRTGDRVRLNLDGTLEFIERLDSQVKIRGYRIELGEIESVLARQPHIEQAVVVVRKERSGEKTLVGYYKAADNLEIHASELRAALQEKLPAYMVPPVLMGVDHFPLTPTGKVDRGKLADPAYWEGRSQDACVERNAKILCIPGSVADPKLRELEETLCTWCAALLNTPAVSPLDNFFEIGGQSLVAAQLTQKIAAAYGKDLRLSEFLKAKTMRAVALRVLHSTEGEQTPWSPVVSLRTEGSKPPVFMIAGLGGNVVNFEFVAPSLRDRPVYGVETQGLDENGEILTSLEDMARSYLKAVRAAVPHGPYHLVGYSFGGILAFEMAQQLRADGCEVGLLGLVDTTEWTYSRGVMASLNLAARLDLLYGDTFRKLVFGPDRRQTFIKRVNATLEHYKLTMYARLGRQAPSSAATAEHRNYHALTRYVPARYDGDLHLFRCFEDRSYLRGTDPALGWGRLCSDVTLLDIPGEHETVFTEPFARHVGEKLRHSLDSMDAYLASKTPARVLRTIEVLPSAS